MTNKADPSGDPMPAFLDANPDIQFVDAFIVDLNGILRGKRLPRSGAKKLFRDGLRLPRSVVGVDIWGTDVFDNGLVLETGDSDGVCLPASPEPVRVPWAEKPTAQAHLMMTDANRSPFDADPRQTLIEQVQACNRLDLFPVAALEMEFYLLTPEYDDHGRPALPAKTGKTRRVRDGQVYAMSTLDRHAGFLDDLYAACAAQDIPLDAAIVEAGPGQFEVNLKHHDNPVRAADQAVLLRRAIKGVAARYDRLASFMAKPFDDLPGNGMHAHISIVDAAGRNLFDEGPGSPDFGSTLLLSAVAGLIETAGEAMILFAPNGNSYRRFQEASHAPTRLAWGWDNRTTAIRIPEGDGADRRFEHRIAGADANPYLLLAGILAGLRHGVENKLVPPAPVAGNAYDHDGPALPTRWEAALQRFETSAVIRPSLGERLSHVYTALKHQEIETTARRITDFEYDSYLQSFG